MTERPLSAHAARTGFFVRRAVATAIDYTLAAAPLAALGSVALRRRYAAGSVSSVRAHSGHGNSRLKRLLIALGVTAPVTILLATAEAHGGSPGKRLLGLEVRTADDLTPMPLRTALVRALLKTGVPWELGHQAVWDFHGGDDLRRRGIVLTGCAYLALVAQAIMAARSAGRTYADLAAGTVVVASSPKTTPTISPWRAAGYRDER